MKQKSTSKSAFFNLRVLIASVLCLFGVFVALLASGALSNAFAQTKSAKGSGVATRQDAPDAQAPDVVQLVGPVRLDLPLNDLPYIPPKTEFEERPLTRYPHHGGQTGTLGYDVSGLAKVQALLKNLWRPTPAMPSPILTFEGISLAQSGCGCFPPDTNGDVGPNHYVQAVNSSFKVFDKNGNTLAGPITFSSFFVSLTGTACSGGNQTDPIVFYDQIADRWVVSDLAYVSFPGNSFWECIGVSQSPDPVAGPWVLYAIQTDPANPTFLGDYPKFALWPNPHPGGAYHLTANLFSSPTTFEGVRVYALDRASMLGGGPTNAIAFTITPAGLGDSYRLVPAGFRTGDPPPAARDEMLLAIDSPANGGVVQTHVHGWLFHVDFVNLGNSTIGVAPNHSPNAEITVNSFVDAFTTTSNLVPQQGTTAKLDTIGDCVMTPNVYENRSGTESLWADHTVILNYPNGPTAVRWYQFDVTGGNFPATPAQQQDWTNGNDGLWRWLPSIAVDQNGNTAIGYSTSSPSIFPSIRYAGRLAADPLNDLGEGEAIMTSGGGAQTSTGGRWGDYSMTTIDPSDGTSFWHTNEYYPASASVNWFTRVGKFNFQGGGGSPTPTPSGTPSATPTARSTPSPRPRPTPPPRP